MDWEAENLLLEAAAAVATEVTAVTSDIVEALKFDEDMPQAMDIGEEDFPSSISLDSPFDLPVIEKDFEIGECERAQRQAVRGKLVYPFPIRYTGPLNVVDPDINILMSCLMRRWIIIYPSTSSCPGLLLWDPLFEYTEALCQRGDNVTAMMNLLVNNVRDQDKRKFVMFAGPSAVSKYMMNKGNANWKDQNRFNVESLRTQTRKNSGKVKDFNFTNDVETFEIDPRVTGLDEEKRKVLRDFFIEEYVGKGVRGQLIDKTPQQIANILYSRRAAFDTMIQGCGGIVCAFDPLQQYTKDLKALPEFCNLHSKNWVWEGKNLLKKTKALHALLVHNSDDLHDKYSERVTKIRAWSGDNESECQKVSKARKSLARSPDYPSSPLKEKEALPSKTRQTEARQSKKPKSTKKATDQSPREMVAVEEEIFTEIPTYSPPQERVRKQRVTQEREEQRQQEDVLSGWEEEEEIIVLQPRINQFIPPPNCVVEIYEEYPDMVSMVDKEAHKVWTNSFIQLSKPVNTEVYQIWNEIEKSLDYSNRMGNITSAQARCLLDWLAKMLRDTEDVRMVAYVLFPQSRFTFDQLLNQ